MLVETLSSGGPQLEPRRRAAQHKAMWPATGSCSPRRQDDKGRPTHALTLIGTGVALLVVLACAESGLFSERGSAGRSPLLWHNAPARQLVQPHAAPGPRAERLQQLEEQLKAAQAELEAQKQKQEQEQPPPPPPPPLMVEVRELRALHNSIRASTVPTPEIRAAALGVLMAAAKGGSRVARAEVDACGDGPLEQVRWSIDAHGRVESIGGVRARGQSALPMRDACTPKDTCAAGRMRQACSAWRARLGRLHGLGGGSKGGAWAALACVPA